MLFFFPFLAMKSDKIKSFSEVIHATYKNILAIALVGLSFLGLFCSAVYASSISTHLGLQIVILCCWIVAAYIPTYFLIEGPCFINRWDFIRWTRHSPTSKIIGNVDEIASRRTCYTLFWLSLIPSSYMKQAALYGALMYDDEKLIKRLVKNPKNIDTSQKQGKDTLRAVFLSYNGHKHFSKIANAYLKRAGKINTIKTLMYPFNSDPSVFNYFSQEVVQKEKEKFCLVKEILEGSTPEEVGEILKATPNLWSNLFVFVASENTSDYRKLQENVLSDIVKIIISQKDSRLSMAQNLIEREQEFIKVSQTFNTDHRHRNQAVLDFIQETKNYLEKEIMLDEIAVTRPLDIEQPPKRRRM